MAFGIDMGPSSQENQQYGALTSGAGFATGLGESDLTASSNFMQAILSGDPTKIAQALAPQVSAAKTSAQQNTKTANEFGTRSGGTAASTAETGDRLHSDLTNLIGSLTGGAATSLGSEGSGLLSTGLSATEGAFGEANQMQQQRAEKWNDIFNSIGSTAGAVAGFPGVGKSVGAGLNAAGGGLQDAAWGF